MNVYVYQAALYCETCIQAELAKQGKAPEYTYDSDDYPKGPYADGGGESDSPEHCDGCHTFLENPLTSDGVIYVREAIAEDRKARRYRSAAYQIWRRFYAEELRG